MMLTLHIGLPKTGTTALQNTVFPHYLGIEYCGKGGGPNTNQSLSKSLLSCWYLLLHGKDYGLALESWIDLLAKNKSNSILISEENLSAWKSPRKKSASEWIVKRNSKLDAPRSGIHPIVEFLSQIKSKLPAGWQLKVILTLRNQTEFLGSLAAEVRNNIPNFVEAALETNDASLRYFDLVSSCQNVLGKQNLLILLYEEGLRKNSDDILNFLGAASQLNSTQLVEHVNQKKDGENRWVKAPRTERFILGFLRRLNAKKMETYLSQRRARISASSSRRNPIRQQVIVISADSKLSIQNHFRRQNLLLSELLSKDLCEHGY